MGKGLGQSQERLQVLLERLKSGLVLQHSLELLVGFENLEERK